MLTSSLARERMLSTVLITTLVVSPVAFLAGWLLAKVLFRHLSVRRPVARPLSERPDGREVLRAAFAGEPVEQAPDPVRLQAQLDASRLEAETLRNELLLIRRGIAESEQTIYDLKSRLSAGVVPPEDTPAAASGKEAAFRRLLAVQQERVNRRDLRVRELRHALQGREDRLKQIEGRFRSWRGRVKPLTEQLRQQQRLIIELREQLRQRAASKPRKAGRVRGTAAKTTTEVALS